MRTAVQELRLAPRREAEIRARAAPLVIVLDIRVLPCFVCVTRRGILCLSVALRRAGESSWRWTARCQRRSGARVSNKGKPARRTAARQRSAKPWAKLCILDAILRRQALKPYVRATDCISVAFSTSASDVWHWRATSPISALDGRLCRRCPRWRHVSVDTFTNYIILLMCCHHNKIRDSISTAPINFSLQSNPLRYRSTFQGCPFNEQVHGSF